MILLLFVSVVLWEIWTSDASLPIKKVIFLCYPLLLSKCNFHTFSFKLHLSFIWQQMRKRPRYFYFLLYKSSFPLLPKMDFSKTPNSFWNISKQRLMEFAHSHYPRWTWNYHVFFFSSTGKNRTTTTMNTSLCNKQGLSSLYGQLLSGELVFSKCSTLNMLGNVFYSNNRKFTWSDTTSD